MPAVATPLAVRCTIVATQSNGDVNENVLHFKTSSGATIDQTFADALGLQVVTDIIDHITPVRSTGLKIVKTVTEDLRTVPHPRFETAWSSTGASSSDAMPWQGAIVASLRTALAGRSGRGRVFWGGFTVDSVDTGGIVVADTVTRIEAWGTQAMSHTVIGGQPCQLAVFSRKLNQVNVVTAVQADNRWDVQRRRANRRLF